MTFYSIIDDHINGGDSAWKSIDRLLANFPEDADAMRVAQIILLKDIALSLDAIQEQHIQ